jgi:hypothetical protein
MRKKVSVCFLFLFFVACVSCKPEISPCNCANNLLTEENNYDEELDEACDAYLEKLNEKELKRWTDSMMNCVSESK